MKSKTLSLFLGLTLAVVALGGCGPALPTCADAALVQPVQVSPAMWGVVGSLTPTLTWSYPDATCNPQGYAIRLKTGPYFGDNLGGGTGNPSTSWSPALPLEPATEYAWAVQPVNGTHFGPSVGFSYFFTGPYCDAGTLKAPELMSPPNDWVVTDLGDLSFIWDYPDACLPNGYRINLADGPDFDASVWNGATGNPSTRWGVGNTPLNNCTRYYWQVASYKDSEMSQFSDIRTLYVHLAGTVCPAETTSMIRGSVWQDQCATPDGPLPDPLPTGCIATGGGGAAADGLYAPYEFGIEGVIISLASGSCPSTTILRDGVTTHDGTYAFYWMGPGTYCLSVDALNPYNFTTLIPGLWTYPPVPVGDVDSQTVVLGSGEDANADFGWWPTATGSLGPSTASISGMVFHDMCSVPPGTTPAPVPLPDGCIVDEFGAVHADGTHQASEPGIAGVEVYLGPGDCPSTGLAQAVTDADGLFSFTDLPQGNYCLSSTANEGSTNAAILLPGRWTMVPSGHEGNTYRAIMLMTGDAVTHQDFGWDYDNLPAVGPHFKLNLNANCHIGPGLDYASSAVGTAGLSYPIEGISTDYLWYYVNFDGQLRCWFGKGAGTPDGDLSQLPFGPMPQGGQQVACSSYTDPKACISNSACQWVNATIRAPYCTNK